MNDRVALARSLRAVAAKASAAMLARRPRWTEPARIDAATWRAMLEAEEAAARGEGRLGQQGDMLTSPAIDVEEELGALTTSLNDQIQGACAKREAHAGETL